MALIINPGSQYKFNKLTTAGQGDIVRSAGLSLHTLQIVLSSYSASTKVSLLGSLDPITDGRPIGNYTPTNFFTLAQTASLTANGVYAITVQAIVNWISFSFTGTATLDCTWAGGSSQ